MPHFIVEHSANFARDVDLEQLGELIRDVAVETGVFPHGGVRVRFRQCEPYVIADGHPDNRALTIVVRMGQGRTLEVRQSAGQKIFDAVCAFIPDADGHDLINLELVEIENDVSWKKNSISPRLKAEGKV